MLGEAGAGPWLSILIPAYNAARYIEECLQSVIEQDLDGVEILVTNDCSTDRTVDIVERFAAGRPDISFTLLHNEVNRGLSATRNGMLDRCAGRYVWFVDADDRMRPDAVAQLKAIVARHDPDLVICDFADYHRNEDDSFDNPVHTTVFDGPERRLLKDRDVLLSGLFDGRRMHSWSKIAKRSVYGGTLRFPDGRYFEDILVTPMLALRVASYYYEPTAWIDYRKAVGSIIATTPPHKNHDKLRSMAEMAVEVRRPEHGLSDASLLRLDRFCARQIVSCFKHQLAGPDCADRISAVEDCLGFTKTILKDYGWTGHGKPVWEDFWLSFRLNKWRFRARAAVKRAASAKE